MINEALKMDLEDARSDLEEINESGDLEDRMKAALRVDELEKLLNEKEAKRIKAEWRDCGWCGGRGWISEYADTWKCGGCDGHGGSWQ